MRVGLSQTARMEQRLMQSPQMIQAMQILQLSSMELEERIDQELTENPFLELSEGSETDGEKPAEEEAGPSLESMLEELERYERDAPPRTRGSAEDSDKKLEAMNNTPAQYHSLGDALLEQIALSDFDERRRSIAEYLVYSLDPRGYLQEPLDKLVEASTIPG